MATFPSQRISNTHILFFETSFFQDAHCEFYDGFQQSNANGISGSMLSRQEVSDWIAIEDLLSRYSYAIDERNWDALDHIFMGDAVIDYTGTGGTKGSLKQLKAWLKALARFRSYQHAVATRRLDIYGDTARCRSVLFNPIPYRADVGAEPVFFIGLWYRDRLVRTGEGWRIGDRYEERASVHNIPICRRCSLRSKGSQLIYSHIYIPIAEGSPWSTDQSALERDRRQAWGDSDASDCLGQPSPAE